MRKFSFITILTAMVVSFSSYAAPKEVSLKSLLDEMVDRESVARFPDPAFVSLQASSYDRRTVSKDKNGWFANYDRSHFIRVERNSGRKEYVMMESSAPGAIVRFWMTFAGPESGQGTLRIYLDGSDVPAIEGPVLDILSGTALTGEPLATSVSKLSPYERRGHDLYLPIPYASACKVTYESDRLIEEHVGAVGKEDEKVYYNIDYRQYERGTRVQSFSKEILEEAKSQIDEVCSLLSSWQKVETPQTLSLDAEIASGESRSWSITGRKAIRSLAMTVEAENLPQALRSLVLDISFDGENTVWVPVGDFFGTGYKTAYTSTWIDRFEDGHMQALWVMPFRKDCVITLRNLSEETIVVKDAAAGVSPWKWDSRSMHFGVSWHEYTNIKTGRHEDARDLNFATLYGQGVYVGDGVTLFNTAPKWWGEGDEKVYVDWETFPSIIGTGTEDYYGYAWCRPEIFTGHPFIAQPIGDGDLDTGYVSNRRYRSLDGIPFRESLVFDMELFHWSNTRINYAPVSFWYLKPGGRTAIPHDEAGAKNPVMLK